MQGESGDQGGGGRHLLTFEIRGLHLLTRQNREETERRRSRRRRKKAVTLLSAVVSTGGREGRLEAGFDLSQLTKWLLSSSSRRGERKRRREEV